MQEFSSFLESIDGAIGGGKWFVYLLLGTGLFFTLYLRFPQFRYFKHALKIVRGKFDRAGDTGDTSHFQALTTALSGTVGTGNIAGVALAIHLGGPAALFWMLMTAFLGMTTKFVEVTLSHKYRDKLNDGSISGGPMYYMKKRLNININGKVIKTGMWMGGFFAVATLFSSLGTGCLPQVNSISDSINATFGIDHIITGAVLALVLAVVIIGGIKRIAKVTERLVPGMAVIYFIGAIAVILFNYENIVPSLVSIVKDVFTGTAAAGGFLGAGFAFAFKRGVNRGLFSNEAGQGSAPIAHAAARAHEPVSEGLVAILEPFIDTIVICTITGLVLLSSGVWKEKLNNTFENTDLEIIVGNYSDKTDSNKTIIYKHITGEKELQLFSGELTVADGKIIDQVSFIHARSLAENVKVYVKDKLYSGPITILNGKLSDNSESISLRGNSLIHSAPLTTEAFKRSFFGDWGQYIVSIGLLLFAFSTAISWSYYGGRAMTYLFGQKSVIYYRFGYVFAFFFGSFTDTTIIWIFSGITIAFMTIPNLISIVLLCKEMKGEVRKYWVEFKEEHPDIKIPEKV